MLTLTFRFKPPSHTLNKDSRVELAKQFETSHGHKLINFSPAALKIYEKNRRAKGLLRPLNRKYSTFVRKKYTAKRHYARKHNNVAPALKIKAPIAKALQKQRLIAERKKLLLPEALAELGGLAAMQLLRHGLSGNMVNEIRSMTEHMLKALRVAPAKSTRLGEGGHPDEVVDKLASVIRLRLRGVGLVLAIDAPAKRYAGGG